ncbi:hypothetical protein BgiBS90_009588 [Biomphalaria glabrata]|nr:hypothetical protein BgiBS90_009588 [Biomphalaria glabrata]
MDEFRLCTTTLVLVFLLHVSNSAPQGYYGPPQPPYLPQPQYPPQSPFLPPPNFPRPPPNNFLYPPPPMSMTDLRVQLANSGGPLPPLPPVGPHDIGKPMPLEAAAAMHAPASSYGNTQVEHEMEQGAGGTDPYGSPQSSLLDSYYSGRPSGGIHFLKKQRWNCIIIVHHQLIHSVDSFS